MQTVRVIRIEHYRTKTRTYEDQKEHYAGVYQHPGNQYMNAPSDIYEKMRSVPCPDYGFMQRRRNMIFAFTSIEHLMRYFTEDVLKHISENGFIIAVYEVHTDFVDYCESGVQCVFCPVKAKKVKRKFYKDQSTLQALAA